MRRRMEALSIMWQCQYSVKENKLDNIEKERIVAEDDPWLKPFQTNISLM